MQSEQAQAINWLLEMEIVSDPHVTNSLVLNILKISKHIKDVHLIFDSPRKALLIYVDLSWFGKTFKKTKLLEIITEMLNDILPSYRKRVIANEEIFNKALKIFEERNVKKRNIRNSY